MAKLDLSYDIVNYTPATASPVDANFDAVEQFVNQELIERDGTVAMRAQLKLVGDPVNALDAAPKQYVDQVLPLGIILMHGGSAAPPGGRWAVCNGAELQTSQYPDLYNIIGHNFSPAGTPGSRFNLPNLRDRVGVGVGTNTTLGETGGYRNGQVIEHKHGLGQHKHSTEHDHDNATSATAGAHTHTISLRANTGTSGGAAIGAAGQATPPTGTTSSDGAHDHTINIPKWTGMSGEPDNNDSQTVGQDPDGRNMPPFVGLLYIIRVR
jgi:microcystin-dependent protein